MSQHLAFRSPKYCGNNLEFLRDNLLSNCLPFWTPTSDHHQYFAGREANWQILNLINFVIWSWSYNVWCFSLEIPTIYLVHCSSIKLHLKFDLLKTSKRNFCRVENLKMNWTFNQEVHFSSPPNQIAFDRLILSNYIFDTKWICCTMSLQYFRLF